MAYFGTKKTLLIGLKGAGLPTGGTAGQVLKKKSATDYDYEWGESGGRTVYSATLSADGGDWTSDSNGFYTDLTVAGLLATDTPIIDLDIDTSGNIGDQERDWSKVYKATASADSLRVYATEVPDNAITIKIMVVR